MEADTALIAGISSKTELGSLKSGYGSCHKSENAAKKEYMHLNYFASQEVGLQILDPSRCRLTSRGVDEEVDYCKCSKSS